MVTQQYLLVNKNYLFVIYFFFPITPSKPLTAALAVGSSSSESWVTAVGFVAVAAATLSACLYVAIAFAFAAVSSKPPFPLSRVFDAPFSSLGLPLSVGHLPSLFQLSIG